MESLADVHQTRTLPRPNPVQLATGIFRNYVAPLVVWSIEIMIGILLFQHGEAFVGTLFVVCGILCVIGTLTE